MNYEQAKLLGHGDKVFWTDPCSYTDGHEHTSREITIDSVQVVGEVFSIVEKDPYSELECYASELTPLEIYKLRKAMIHEFFLHCDHVGDCDEIELGDVIDHMLLKFVETIFEEVHEIKNA